MGLFGKKKTEGETPAAPKKAAKPSVGAPIDVMGVIIKPRITEKAALLSDKNIYTFEIRKNATKHEVRDAIKALYNVTPARVRVVKKEARHSMSRMRGRDVMEHGLKKAYVYLKKGDRIELV
jgi:large subunit ribosomal protein L23